LIVSEKEIPKIIAHLKSNGLAALPTETVYGLAGNALQEASILEIFRLKKRPKFDPLIVHLKNSSELRKYAKQPFPKKAIELIETFWPGPLTIILPKTKLIPDLVTSGLPYCAFRIPKHPLFKKVLSHLDFPLAAPSANPFGYVSPTTAQHVENQLNVKFILDGGPCKFGLESSIVAFLEDEKPKLLRYGSISFENLLQTIPELVEETASTNEPLGPGQLSKHYATNKNLFLLDNWHDQKLKPSDALICFGRISAKGENIFNLSQRGDFEEAGKNLFGTLRKLDSDPKIKKIYAVRLPNRDFGKAINNRLERAAASH